MCHVGNMPNSFESHPQRLRDWHACQKLKSCVSRNQIFSEATGFVLSSLKWPSRDRMSRRIFIQQDGAKNHIHEDDKEFNDTLMELIIDAVLYMQTPNSPDINLLDLGF